MKKNLPSLQIDLLLIRIALISCLICFMSSFFRVHAQQLLKDINQDEDGNYSEYSDFVTLNNKLLFVSEGHNLYTGTVVNGKDTLTLIKAFNRIGEVIVIGEVAYFNATTAETGAELWKTDGTTEGTVLVKDGYAGTSSLSPTSLTAINNVLFFIGSDKAGKEIWTSDGTSVGTYMVKDIFPKGGSSNPASLTNVNGTLFFAANDGSRGYELWRSNGTADGTVLVKDIRTESKVSSSPDKITNVNGVAFFVAGDVTNGRELWKSDGTETGTVLVKDIRAGSNPSAIDNLVDVNGIAYFTATDAIHGQEVWRSDGTDSGTYLLKDLTPGSAGSNGEYAFSQKMGNFTNVNGLLFFTAYAGSNYYIWKSDGTAAGTVQVQLCHGPGIGQPKPNFKLLNGFIYYFNEASGEYYEYSMWRMNADGTNPKHLGNLEIDAYDYFYPEATIVNGYVYFFFREGMYYEYYSGFKIYKTNGNGITRLEADTYIGTQGSNPKQFTRINDKVVFVTDDAHYNYQLWATDGSSYGTTLVMDLYDDAKFIKTLNGKTYVAAGSSLALYETDGTTEGTRIVAIDGSKLGVNTLDMVNSKLFYSNGGGQMWSVDPVTSEQTLMKQVYAIASTTTLNGAVLFRVTTENKGDEIWRTNGTAQGTYRVKTITSARTSIMLDYPSATIKNTHFFLADDGEHGHELWRTQGSGSSTYMVADLNPNDDQFRQYNYYEYDFGAMSVLRDSLYFSAVDASGAWSLFKTNGTAAGIKKIKTLNSVLHMIPAGNKMYMIVRNESQSAYGYDLWVTNGTDAGTIKLQEFSDAYYTSIHTEVIDGIFYMTQGGGRSSMIRSDGTVCGTQLVSFNTSCEGEFENLNGQIVFSGGGDKTGYEPYIYTLAQISLSPCDQTLSANALAEETILFDEETRVVMQAPNPFMSDFALSINGGENEIAHVDVFTSSGAPVESVRDLQCNTEYRFGNQWSAGMYILKVNRSGKMYTEKIIKRP